ncbi:hypothetical protein F2Q69_00051245 [Brassica cretica]|uniref:Uncharacterized protein n=1 Tax=Brassica cretica TaxID=69181 RepID=A0A8S9PPN3_BRACR|nr:hypothetical protein F2Q69_00051245 [Brassica cretica]
MKEKTEASEKKKKADVKRRKGEAAKRRVAIKKKREAAKKSETTEKKRKRDSGLDGGSSSNPTKRTRNRVRETAASPSEHQGVHAPTPAAELPSQGDSEGTPRPVIPSQPQKSPTPTHAASEAENQQQPRVTSGSSTKSPSHRVDEQNGEEIGSNNRDSNAPEISEILSTDYVVLKVYLDDPIDCVFGPM